MPGRQRLSRFVQAPPEQPDSAQEEQAPPADTRAESAKPATGKRAVRSRAHLSQSEDLSHPIGTLPQPAKALRITIQPHRRYLQRRTY